MADDVDMCGEMFPIPVTPTRSLRSDPFSSPSPSCRQRKKKNIEFSQQIPCDIPSTANCSGPENRPFFTQKVPTASLSQTTDDAFQAVSEASQAKHTVLTTISKALDQAIQSSKETAPSYAIVASTLPKLPPPIRLVGSQPRIRTGQRLKALDNTTDNRIFVRLPEGHASRQHHIHAVKAALTQKLGLNGRPIKGIQHVKSGLTILPADPNQAAQILEKAPEITSVLGDIVEKAEKWHNYLLDHVPMKINCIDKATVEVTPK
ncbi:hypothetical protein EPUL_006164 [Erysiphe pulchra]|uniref:Uncharacterized protein n=1 Tax=Erysiphe pulchra TaxID=225359 RepID=A0A2S4PJH8_9PEZI|nr:hypothetical protein EPUL_006164 [Erysiphe pulchra]